jgi:hypothetical protein
MKWNKQGAQFQTSRKGTSKAHEYYFITTISAGGKGWLTGYKGYGRQVIMQSAGTFNTPAEARAYCEKVDREALVIEEVCA